VRILGRALRRRRLAHAYLFHGPVGVGKEQAAMEVARGLLCRQPRQHQGCGECGSCRKFSAGSHPDFLDITPQGVAIRIDQIRAMKKALSFPPLESATRVVVIHEVHTMRREAANSLLKILEEPPPGNILLLIATVSEPLLDTIVSRCQVVPFYPLPLKAAAEVIRRDAPELTLREAETLAALLEGSPGRALDYHKRGLPAQRHHIITAILTSDAGEPGGVEELLKIAAKAADRAEDLTALLDLLRLFFRDVLVAATATGQPAFVNRDMEGEIERARQRWNLQELFAKLQAVDQAEKALARNCNRALVCEVLFFQLATECAGARSPMI